MVPEELASTSRVCAVDGTTVVVRADNAPVAAALRALAPRLLAGLNAPPAPAEKLVENQGDQELTALRVEVQVDAPPPAAAGPAARGAARGAAGRGGAGRSPTRRSRTRSSASSGDSERRAAPARRGRAGAKATTRKASDLDGLAGDAQVLPVAGGEVGPAQRQQEQQGEEDDRPQDEHQPPRPAAAGCWRRRRGRSRACRRRSPPPRPRRPRAGRAPAGC